MTRLLEYQAKQILRRFEIPTPDGQVVCTPCEADDVAAAIGYPAMVKAQIRSGKRGKSGGIRPVTDEAELKAAVADLMGATVRGLSVDALLIEQSVDVVQEMYLGVTADPSSRAPVLILCEDGGVDIEETARVNPDAIRKLPVDVLRGVYAHDALNLVRATDSLTSRQKLGVAYILSLIHI